MLIGYARASIQNQNLDRQLDALRVADCKKVFTEKVRGKTVRRRLTLDKAIDALGEGDVFVLAEWDCATRSLMDGITIMQRVAARGATIKVLDKPHLDLTSKTGQDILAFLSALAHDERERLEKLAADGRSAARAKGVVLGRRPTLTEDQAEDVRRLLSKGESCRSIAKLFDCHFSTISRYQTRKKNCRRRSALSGDALPQSLDGRCLTVGGPVGLERETDLLKHPR